METQYTRLSMTPSGVPPVIYMSQNDIGRPIGFICDADLSDYSVVLEGTRTDGTPITVAVTVDGNICAFETTATMTNKADVYIAQIVVTNASGKHISSIPIKCVVVLAAMDENSEGIEEDAPLYQQYTGTVQSLIADIRTQLNAETAARQAAVSAEASARQAADNTLQSNINAEASTRATQDASLQSQINQLVAPSGEAPSAAEIENARVGADGTVYQTLGDAIRGQVTDVKSAITEKTYNLVSYILSGLTVDNTGGMANYGGSTSMVVAPVFSGETYTIKTDDSSNFVGAFYEQMPTASTTASYNSQRIVSGPKTFTAPITGYVAFRTSNGYAQAQMVEGDTDKPYIKPITAVDIIARNTIDGIMTPTYDVEDVTNITYTESYYMQSTGGQAGPYDDWQYGKISVSPGDVYEVKCKTGAYALPWLILNGSNVIQYSSYPVGQPVQYVIEKVTIPPTGQYLVVNNRKDGNITIKALEQTGEAIDGAKVSVNNIPLSEFVGVSNVLVGKVICCCGDSITYGDDMDTEGFTNESNCTVYQSDSSGNFTQITENFRKTWNWQIANRNKMTLYNAGVNGSTMQGISSRNGFSVENGRYTKLPNNIDYLLIWFGWNDTAYGTLGTISDTTNESYYGGYNVVLPYLINKYPYAKIALIVPFGTDEGHRNAIRLLGNKWGVAVWDNYQGGTPLYYGKEDSVGVEQSVILSNRAKFQANGAHPNFKGHRQLGDMIEEFLRGI